MDSLLFTPQPSIGMLTTHRTLVSAEDQVGAARRQAVVLAESLGGDATFIGKVALAVTESARNLVRHAGGGELLVQPVAHGSGPGVEVLALDKGPGMNLAECLRDGHSTGGTSGEGLGALNRMADCFQVYSRPNLGTALLCRLLLPSREPANRRFAVGGVNVPLLGETLCGDAWAVTEDFDYLRVVVADGLGHGPIAAEAAQAVLARFAPTQGLGLKMALQDFHEHARHTRGAAVAMVEIKAGKLKVCGLGNISGCILQLEKSQHLVSMPGTVGVNIRTPQEFTHAWDKQSTLVMYSDGLSSQWSLEKYPGLLQRDPSLIAAVLYRDFTRTRDDATVVVAQSKA